MKTFREAEEILAESLPNYTHRPQQAQLAEAIERALEAGDHLLADAPVGTGKSMAALIPSILSGKRVIIATATNVLASQYYDNDLPFLKQHLPVDFSYAMVKGKSNYYCSAEGELNKDNSSYVELIKSELRQRPGHTGDLDRFGFSIPQDERRYLSVSSTECPGLSNCQVGRELGCLPGRARERAQDAQIVVTNISALILNAKLEGHYLGHYDALIIDEGHELDPYALSSLAATVNFAGIRDLAERSMEFVPNSSEPHNVIDAVSYIEDLMEIMMGENDFLKVDHELMVEMVDDWMPILEGINFIKNITSDVAKRNNSRLEENPQDPIAGEAARKASKLSRQAENVQEILENLILGETNYVRWLEKIEVRGRGNHVSFRTNLRISPIESAPFLKKVLWGNSTLSVNTDVPDDSDWEVEEVNLPPVILMSGTLAANGNFSFIKRTLGAWEADEIQVDSPFDYQNQARLFIPNRSVPVPGAFDQWLSWYVQNTSELIRASEGGALLLFTSRRAMEAAYERMRPILSNWGYRTLIQDGETSNNDLAQSFNDETSAVLFGLKSFFQGFDPRQGSCRLVVLDKLPFPVPTDIIFEARAELAEEDGESSFSTLSIPMLIVTLRQAMGRLIRSNQHRGVMAIMDSRLSTKQYGNLIINSLPPAPKIDRISQAVEFLSSN